MAHAAATPKMVLDDTASGATTNVRKTAWRVAPVANRGAGGAGPPRAEARWDKETPRAADGTPAGADDEDAEDGERRADERVSDVPRVRPHAACSSAPAR